MNVIPLSADSLGVRSMATYVECGDTQILIDPGASLAASRFGLPPAEEEWGALKRANERIAAYAARAGLVFVSHYHEDHFRYDATLYEDRSVWAKDPKRMIGARQAGRAALLWKALDGRCRLDAAEGRRLETRDAVLTASPPLGHGLDGTGLGYVVALTVTDRREGTRFVHASDVQGPLSPVAAAYLLRERPNLLYLSGPPAYLEARLGSAVIEQGVANLLRIIEATGCQVILDHHALRAPDFRERLARLWGSGRVQTAAGFLGLPDAPLEARRPILWAGRRKGPAPMPMRGPGLRGKRRSAKMDGRRTPYRRKEGTTQ
jgi:predicted metallo-beta-lactamase superfamily hydrolase